MRTTPPPTPSFIDSRRPWDSQRLPLESATGAVAISVTSSDSGTAYANDSLFLACRAAEVADEYRAKNIKVLDLRSLTPIFDFFVISSGTNRRQMHAVAEEVDREMETLGTKRRSLEGYRESQWILQDYGDIVLHVFTDEMRDVYDLETLWADADRIDWETELNRFRNGDATGGQ